MGGAGHRALTPAPIILKSENLELTVTKQAVKASEARHRSGGREYLEIHRSLQITEAEGGDEELWVAQNRARRGTLAGRSLAARPNGIATWGQHARPRYRRCSPAEGVGELCTGQRSLYANYILSAQP